MSSLHGRQLCALVLATSLAACSEGKTSVAPGSLDSASAGPSYTLSSGSTSKVLGRATFSDPHDQNFDIKRKTGDWQMQIKGKPAFDIVIQTIDFPAGSSSGWHSHPGPVFIQVVSGTMTFYESTDPTCTPIVRTAGQGYLDLGEDSHIARNETSLPSQNLVTYFTPPGAPTRINAPAPGNCPF